MEIQAFLTLLAQSLLVLAIPILIAYGAQWVRLKGKEFQSRLTTEQQAFITAGIQMAVRAAEQSGLSGQLAGGGAAKKKYAIDAAKNYLAKLGVNLDVDTLATLVESEVLKQFNNASPPPDTAETRSALLDKAIDAAVLAAQQSGLAGIIRNAGGEKKRYAADFASRYLAEHGIRVDPAVIDALIESQIMRLKLNGAGRLA